MTYHQLALLLSTYTIRSFYDKATRSHWFCAVDICAILFDTTNYSNAQMHWKNIKRREPYFARFNGYINTQVSLQAQDNKLYLSDMLDLAGILALLKAIAKSKPTKNRQRCQCWLDHLHPQALLQAVRERSLQGHFELLQTLRTRGRQLCMTRTWIGRVFQVGGDVPAIHEPNQQADRLVV